MSFQIIVPALLEILTNCTVACVAERQVRPMLCSTLAAYVNFA